MRHGQTDWNKGLRLQGRTDIPLNEKGKKAAEITSEGLQDVAFDVVFTSPLQRAKDTAKIIMRDREIELIEDERIIEIAFGKYEGCCYAKENYNIPDKDFYKVFKESPEMYCPPEGAESFEDLDKRAREFLTDLIENQDYAESTILIATHGAMLSGILRVVKNNPVEKFWGDGLHKNCAFSVIEVKDGEMSILKEGVTFYNESDM